MRTELYANSTTRAHRARRPPRNKGGKSSHAGPSSPAATCLMPMAIASSPFKEKRSAGGPGPCDGAGQNQKRSSARLPWGFEYGYMFMIITWTLIAAGRPHAETRLLNPTKRVVVTPPPGHPSSEVQLNSTCT